MPTQDDKPTVSFRVSKSVHQKLKQIGDREGLLPSVVARIIVRAYLLRYNSTEHARSVLSILGEDNSP